MQTDFPQLFKKSSKGKIETWKICVDVYESEDARISWGAIITVYGELGGKFQTTRDVVKKGKNVGKKNETTPYDQAVAEAKAKWEKQLKSGYIYSVEEAEKGIVDSNYVEGGELPMLAHKFRDHSDKIEYPCAMQPKLDGIRCIALKRGLEVTLWSRTRKPITSCPHIIEAIKEQFSNVENITLDGELFNYDYRKDFEKIVSAVRKAEPSEDSEKVHYYIYDVLDYKNSFDVRTAYLTSQMFMAEEPLYLVPTYICQDEEEAIAKFEEYLAEGQEGLMLRNWKGKYVGKRSYDLLKMKEMEDTEFEIIGVVEGRGKLAGLLGTFTCKTSDGKEFECSLNGDQESTRKYIQDPSLAIGRWLTVQHQGYTAYGKPRIPKGLRIREMDL